MTELKPFHHLGRAFGSGAMPVFDLRAQQHASIKTTIKKPVEVAFFSYDTNHELHPFSEESLRYYYPAFSGRDKADREFPIDLNKGFEKFRSRDDSPDEHLDGLLETLIEAEKRDGKKTETDIVTWRGMMTKILTAPFEFQDGFEMNATCFQGTIFIEENHEHKIRQKATEKVQHSRNPMGNMPIYWGYKFETLSMLDKPWAESTREEIEAREDAVVDNFIQYCSLVKTGIGSSSMVIAGEVDGVLDYKPTDPEQPSRWVELKTARRPESRRDWEIHDRKMLKFWAQSFLLGVPNIVIGYRSRSGHLESLEEVSTMRIPGLVQQHGTFKWDGNVCIRTTAAFLDFLKQTVVGGGVWRIRRAPSRPEIEVFRVHDSGTGDILKPSFLSWRLKLEPVTDGP